MYDEIANLYHLVYDDWPSAIEHQAASLDRLFRELLGRQPRAVLDVSCGIGTQSLGLAALGYEVTASDLSKGVVGIREYRADEDRNSPQVFPYGFREFDGNRYFVFQTRDWKGDSYRVAMYFVSESDGVCDAAVTAGVSTYHAISLDEVQSIFVEAGFSDVRRIDKIMHQPIIVGYRG